MHESQRWGIAEILILIAFGAGSAGIAYFLGDWLTLYDGPLKFQNFLKLWGMVFVGGIIGIVLIGTAIESAIYERKHRKKDGKK
jgi:hypothetical protein